MIAICFSGMDGSGKSTQCQRLKRRLQGVGADVEIIHILSQGKTVGSKSQSLALVKAIHKTLRDLPGTGITRGLKLFTGLSYYLVDSWISHVLHTVKFRNRIVIYDRYFYDPLLIFASNFPRIPWWVIHFSRIFPQGCVTIIMEVPPEVANQRKPEEPLDVLECYYGLYRRLAGILKVRFIDGTKNKIDVEREINQHCHLIFERFEKKLKAI